MSLFVMQSFMIVYNQENRMKMSLAGAILQGFHYARKEVNRMPYKPKRPCRYSGCSQLAVGGGQYCAEHQRAADETYKKFERSPDVNRTYGRSWKRIRDRYVRQHPLCEQCLKEGRLTLVDEVHHILPISQGGKSTPDNLMSLCRSCHNKIHLELGDRHTHE